HPESARTESDLDLLEERLTKELTIPPPYESEWGQTEAALRRTRLHKDIEVLRQAVADTKGWYQQQVVEGDQLRTFARGKPGNARAWREWQTQVDTLLHQTFAHTEAEQLPESDQVTYAAVFHLNGVVKARSDWEMVKQRLERVRDLVAVFGLA